DYLASGNWEGRPGRPTLASAMDVGDPSNMERLRAMCGDDVERVRSQVQAVTVTDSEIRETIVDEYRRHGLPWCPHTATAFHAVRRLPEAERSGRHWAVVATAHAAKFDTIVEPLLGIRIPPPPELARLLALPAAFETVEPRLDEIAGRL